jgi:hypothetical protein
LVKKNTTKTTNGQLAYLIALAMGVDIFEDLVTGTFNSVEQNSYLRILISCIWGNNGHRAGAGCPATYFVS